MNPQPSVIIFSAGGFPPVPECGAEEKAISRKILRPGLKPTNDICEDFYVLLPEL